MEQKKRKAKWQNDYITKTYDRINLTVEKGRKDIIKAHAEAQGESVNGFINRAIEETMKRECAERNNAKSPILIYKDNQDDSCTFERFFMGTEEEAEQYCAELNKDARYEWEEYGWMNLSYLVK